jgi:hypothetical protein
MKKLSIDALKERAEEVQTTEVMTKIEGAAWSDCHGFWGTLGKAFRVEQLDDGIRIGFEFEFD